MEKEHDFEKTTSKADFLNQRGCASLMEGKLQQAMEEFSKAIEMDSSFVEGHKNLAIVCEKMEKYDKALEHFSKALKLKSGDEVSLLACRGFVLCKLEKFVEATMVFVSAIHKDYDELFYNTTKFHYDNLTPKWIETLGLFSGNPESFSKAFCVAIKAKPKNSDLFHCRGIMNMRLKKYDEAKLDLNTAHELNPKNSNIVAHLAEVSWRKSDFSTHLSEVQLSLKLDPQNPLGLCRRGLAHWKNKKFAEAQTDLSAAIKFHPRFPVALNAMGLALEEEAVKKGTTDRAEALKCFDRAIALSSMYSTPIENKGNTLVGMGKYLEAKDEYEKALEINPQGSAAHYVLGRVHEDLSEPSSALLCYEKACEYDKTVYYYFEALGDVLAELRRNEEAVEAFEKAIELQKKAGGSLDTLYYNRAFCYQDMAKKRVNFESEFRKYCVCCVRDFCRAVKFCDVEDDYGNIYGENLKLVIRKIEDMVNEKEKKRELMIEVYAGGLEVFPEWVEGWIGRASYYWAEGKGEGVGEKVSSDLGMAVRVEGRRGKGYYVRGKWWVEGRREGYKGAKDVLKSLWHFVHEKEEDEGVRDAPEVGKNNVYDRDLIGGEVYGEIVEGKGKEGELEKKVNCFCFLFYEWLREEWKSRKNLEDFCQVMREEREEVLENYRDVEYQDYMQANRMTVENWILLQFVENDAFIENKKNEKFVSINSDWKELRNDARKDVEERTAFLRENIKEKLIFPNGFCVLIMGPPTVRIVCGFDLRSLQ